VALPKQGILNVLQQFWRDEQNDTNVMGKGGGKDAETSAPIPAELLQEFVPELPSHKCFMLLSLALCKI